MDIQAGRDRKENLSRLWDQVRPFVCQIANRFGAGDQTEDLIHEGFLGITDAARKYDAGQGAQFLTFAEYDIRARMGRYMGESGPVRLPKWAAGTVRKYRKAVSEFEKAHGREPSDMETAFLLGLNVDYSGQWVRKLNRIRAGAAAFCQWCRCRMSAEKAAETRHGLHGDTLSIRAGVCPP